MEAADYSETHIPTYQTTQCCMQEDHSLNLTAMKISYGFDMFQQFFPTDMVDPSASDQVLEPHALQVRPLRDESHLYNMNCRLALRSKFGKYDDSIQTFHVDTIK
jgi:hypothetical protein